MNARIPPPVSRAVLWTKGHPVLAVFLAALVVRVAAALAINVFFGFESFPDTSGYDSLATDRADGSWRDWDSEEEFFYDRYAGYVLPLSMLYRVFGDHLFLAQLLAALFGAIAAAAACRLTFQVADHRRALIAGGIVALLPVQVVFSSVPYKDSGVWAALALMALLAAWAVRATGGRLAAIGAGLAVLAFWLGHLRVPTFIVACWTLPIVALFGVRRDWLSRLAGAAAIALFVPWYVGAGLAGVDLVRGQSLADIRAQNAAGADSGFIEEEEAEDSLGADLRHLPRGISILIFEPVPGTSFTGTSVRLAQAELPVWYALIGLALVGAPSAFPQRRRLAFLVLASGGVFVVFALLEGNFGTAYRHRAEIVTALAVLAAFGIHSLLQVRARRHARTDAELAAPARS